MIYYSTCHQAPTATLEKAVTKGLAEDRGLYMPEHINTLPKAFFEHIEDLSFQEMSYQVAAAFFGEDVEPSALKQIVCDTLTFDTPLVEIRPGIYALELFHGPTLAFKDVGARFMARLLQYFIRKEGRRQPVDVLVATSGDTGSAVANGFLGVEGIRVHVLYPKGKVSRIQESQFTTLGQNITALEVDGVFDDCQALVKSAFMDAGLNECLRLTSANSINVARFLPQTFYYFNAYAQLKRQLKRHTPLTLGQKAGRQAPHHPLFVCVPSGNFGNLTAGLIAQRMGLPVDGFIAANNANDIVYQYLQTGRYEPRPSVPTLANAMDVGDPSNFARILDLYGGDYATIRSHISGAAYTDGEIAGTMRQCHHENGYVLDPHGACGYQALCDLMPALAARSQPPGHRQAYGIFLETAHPAKFKEKVDQILGIDLDLPPRLSAFMQGKKASIPMPKDFESFKRYLMEQASTPAPLQKEGE